MAKGVIKVVKDNEHGLVTNDNGKDIPFTQPFIKELGLKEGMTVRFDVYTDPTTKEKTAFNVETYRKGIIVVKETDKGFVQDPNFGQIPLFEPMMKEQGIVDGSTVKYDLITTSLGLTGVYVKLAEPTP